MVSLLRQQFYLDAKTLTQALVSMLEAMILTIPSRISWIK
jgi:hypothetical protein